MVKAIPDGYNTVTPYLVVKSPETLIEFAKQAFDAKEHEIYKTPDGKISHAEIQIGDSKIMVGCECDQNKGMASMLYLYVKDVDTVYAKALKAGATKVQAVKDQFYGDRSGGVVDSNGIQWWVATHIEDVSTEEQHKRMQAVAAK